MLPLTHQLEMPLPGTGLKALFKVNECDDRIANLKRLVLLFDECHYLPPETHPTVLGEVLDSGLIARRDGDGNVVTEPFDFFAHTGPGLRYADESIRDPELRDTLTELREAHIAFRVEPEDHPHHEAESLSHARRALAASELMDQVFRELSETTTKQLAELRFTTVHSVDTNSGQKHTAYLLRAPNAIVDSYDITDILTTAHQMGACPIFLDTHHRRELQHRYEKMHEARAAAVKAFPGLQQGSLQGGFGAVSFSVASEVFSDAVLAQRSVSDILRYRARMEEARQRYVSSDLMELTGIVESNPWSDSTQREVKRYVMGKLANDLAVYRQGMRETWEKMFGSLTTGVMRSVQGAGAGGVLGELLPHTSLWEMAVLGTIGGLLKEAPAIAKTLVDSVLAARAQRRNAIAYIAEFH